MEILITLFKQTRLLQHPPPPTRLPPGLHHPLGITPPIRPLNSIYPIPVPLNCRPPPPFFQGHIGGSGPHTPPVPPGLVYPINSQFPVCKNYLSIKYVSYMYNAIIGESSI